MAKAVLALYDDQHTAERVAYDLYHVGVQRDHVKIISGSLSEENLSWFQRSWIEKKKGHYQTHLEGGGVLLIAWVMTVFRKEARAVFAKHKASETEELSGRRWVGFNSTRT